ncbi:MAG: four-carbon acid sugar kinase family protein [Planctomycetaceae bacterium]|nr:four-carbon acid sugar kinase family protein [Planctomycetaceae bacterium]
MIVVIADDLTGAGEISGIGLDYGLKVELQRSFCPQTNAQLLVIDTDTRSLPAEQAGQAIRDVAERLNASGLVIDWIYKKTDSVLRGPVAGELETLRDALHAARVLLVPANPSKGRILRDGQYLIQGKPLCETDFACDPEYPATTSDVLRLPGLSGCHEVHLLNCSRPLPCTGIAIGQAETANDLARWSEKMDGQTLMAGAAEFFEAILQSKGLSRKIAETECCFGSRMLVVCGSSCDSSRQFLRKAEQLGVGLCRMPDRLFGSDCPDTTCFEQWTDQIIRCFEKSSCVMIAIDRAVIENAALARALCGRMAKAVWSVSCMIPLNEIFVEGGATAAAIVERFGWNRFSPCDQLGPGIVRMKVLECDETCLTIKPGSYPWSERIRDVFLKGVSRAN